MTEYCIQKFGSQRIFIEEQTSENILTNRIFSNFCWKMLMKHTNQFILISNLIKNVKPVLNNENIIIDKLHY